MPSGSGQRQVGARKKAGQRGDRRLLALAPSFERARMGEDAHQKRGFDCEHDQRSFHLRHCDQMNMKNLVSRKSAMRMVIEITTTERVVDRPTPSVPPVVMRPK